MAQKILRKSNTVIQFQTDAMFLSYIIYLNKVMTILSLEAANIIKAILLVWNWCRNAQGL